MPDDHFNELRAAVVAGAGVVARHPGVVCVAESDDAGALNRLLDLCAGTAGASSGRMLARRLAGWLGGEDAPSEGTRFGVVAVAGEQWMVFLSGAVGFRVPERNDAFSGAGAAAWVDRLLDPPDALVELALDGVDVPSDLVSGRHDLRSGVVPGSGVVLLTADLPHRSAPARTDPVGSEQQHGHGHGVVSHPPPPPPVGPATEPRPPRRADAILGAPLDEARPPLDVGSPPAAGRSDAGPMAEPAASPESTAEPQARGYLCSRGHLNDPRSHFCVLCGIRMNERTGVLVLGARPPLGLLVLDDGATYTIDAEYLVGRMPDVDERVRDGSWRAIVVEDQQGGISRVHAEVRVNGWDVLLVDPGSRNGTFIAGPGADAWNPVPPRQPHRLVPGTRVRMGGRTLVFESPSGVR
jgi:hypothetical protein